MLQIVADQRQCRQKQAETPIRRRTASGWVIGGMTMIRTDVDVAKSQPSETSYNMLSKTLQGLESGLTVRTIASFGLRMCDVDDSVDIVRLQSATHHGFDQIPVQRDGHVVGVLEQQDSIRTGCVQELHAPIGRFDTRIC